MKQEYTQIGTLNKIQKATFLSIHCTTASKQ